MQHLLADEAAAIEMHEQRDLRAELDLPLRPGERYLPRSAHGRCDLGQGYQQLPFQEGAQKQQLAFDHGL